jgi:hypothetical protein
VEPFGSHSSILRVSRWQWQTGHGERRADLDESRTYFWAFARRSGLIGHTTIAKHLAAARSARLAKGASEVLDHAICRHVRLPSRSVSVSARSALGSVCATSG